MQVVGGANFLGEIPFGADNSLFFLRSNESWAIGGLIFGEKARPIPIFGALDLGKDYTFRIIQASYFIQLR